MMDSAVLLIKMIGCLVMAVQLKPGGTSKAENCIYRCVLSLYIKSHRSSSSIISFIVQTTSNLGQGIAIGVEVVVDV